MFASGLHDEASVRHFPMSRLGLSLIALTTATLAADFCFLQPLSVASAEIPPIQTGLASWYGTEEQGKLTADGEHFDRHQFTAAHRHLPFNTRVRVINEENGRAVEVRINDRGPYVKNRVLDLSEAAAKALDMKREGVTRVKIEVIAQDPPPLTPTSTLP